MKKEWEMPTVKDLKISATQYDARGGRHEDGHYVSYDGQYCIPTYASGVNRDTPYVDVH